MSETISPNGAAGAAASRGEVTKVVVASLIGTTIEWYDFFLYGTVAATVFNELFFPSSDPLVGTMLALTTFALGFAARPIGGVVFGHFGDRIGRKSMLVLTLLLMGAATFAIGLLPTYATLGVGAAVILTLLRLVQGFALGGEWGGSVLIAAEYGRERRRGLRASWPQAGVPIGLLLSTAVLAAVNAMTTEAQFATWGWRIPFLLSITLVVVGLWIRTSIAESPVWKNERETARKADREKPAAPPFLTVFRRHRREVLVVLGARIAENVSYYVFTVFVLTYLAEQLSVSKQTGLNALLVGSLVQLVMIPAWAALSDRLGRRPAYLIGALGVGVWGFAFFPLLEAKSFGLISLAIAGGLFFHAMMYGPQAAFFSELFGTGVRYTGVSIGAQLAPIVGGSVAPLISVALLNAYGSTTPISLYLAGCAVVTLIAVALARETSRTDLTSVDARREAVPAGGTEGAEKVATP
jgi:metabolite-proton symporter